ncbi:MAG: hypothetical protein Q8M01_06795 [Rubrivivax sp.]|nr:hypothetical protein [Rubrivivax sp.]
MTAAPLYTERRRRNYRPAIGIAVLLAGVVALLAVVAPARKAPVAVHALGVGDVLTAGADSAIVRGVLLLRDGTVLAAVSHVRGQYGRTVYVVEGCPTGGVLQDTTTGVRWGWHRGGYDIFARLADVACAPAPPERA